MTRRPARPRPRPRIATALVPVGLLLAATLALAGCAGISGLEKARALTPEQISQKSAELVCARLRTFGNIADVPVNWLSEAQGRTLANITDQGPAGRRAEDEHRA